MKQNKLQVKELITLGVLNAVFIVIFSIVGIVLGMFPVTYLFMPAVVAVPLGVVFMLLMAKVAKTGAFLISGILQGAVLLLLGVYWPVITTIVIAAMIGELIVQGAYKSFKRIATGYAALICGYSLGSFAPLVFFADAYKAMAVGRGYDEGYINKLIELLNGPVLLGILVVSIAGALLGAFLGKRIMKKHFVKAGIV
jgi:energy-coupling factor transport system substrate-specific component